MMPEMLHFSGQELAARRAAAVNAIDERGLDGLVMFKQESMYYLTGYDTMGYITFQCMFLGNDGRLFLLTREPDKRAARLTSTLENVYVYGDSSDVDPFRELRTILQSYVTAGCKLGVEYDCFGLKASHAKRFDTMLEDFAVLHDGSGIVDRLRLIKSDAEIAYVRKAAELTDKALERALILARHGLSEGELFAEMQGEIFRNGGDYSASRWILGTGNHAMLVRHFTGHHNVIESVDQVQLEYGAAYLHYHACLFHTLFVGNATAQQRDMRAVAIEALNCAKAACRPGARVGDMFEAYAKVVDAAGYEDSRLNACGYSLGATYPPTWMDGLLISRGNDAEVETGMVLFPHMVLIDSDNGFTGCAGETILVTENGAEGLSRLSHEVYVL